MVGVSKLLSAMVIISACAGMSTPAWSASDMSEKDYRAALAECKKLAAAKLRDDCVNNAKNRYERGKGIEKKSDSETAKGKAKKGEEKAEGIKNKGKQKGKKK